MRIFATVTIAIASLGLAAPLAVGSADAAGDIIITQGKAMAGGVTPGDDPGFPITISQPGNYKLATDLKPSLNDDTFSITSDNVTLDLAGFTIDGGGIGRNGVFSHRSSVTIRNGTITGMKTDGIQSTGEFWIIENMRITKSGRNGITVGDHTRAYGNMVSQNTKTGLQCGDFCHIESNLISSNGEMGINLFSGMALGNTIVKNQSYGMYMFYGAFGNNTLILNNNDQAGSQVLGATYNLHPNFCNPACP